MENLKIDHHNLSGSVKAKSGKNGKIELLRFLFCMTVLLFHAEKYTFGEPSLKNGIHFALFPHGSIGVEFFFVLSGFLMAKSIFKKVETQAAPLEREGAGKNAALLSAEYPAFIIHKYTSIFPEHLIAFVIAVCAYVFSKGFGITRIIKYVIDSIPNLLLIQMSGISLSNPNHVEWYISCMLIAMAIIYPICRKYYYYFTRYFAPLCSLLILGYMVQTTGALTGVSTWMGICYKSLLRAIAEVALGTTAFELSRYIMKYPFSKNQRILLTLAEAVSVALSMLFVMMTFSKKYEVYVLGLMIVLIALSFSQVTCGSDLFNNKFCYYLGSLSLPVYLGQISAVYLVQGFMADYEKGYQYLTVVILTFVFAYIIMFGGKILRKVFSGNKLR